jgi:uncharacterized repeat protein (TIGR01451 family)
MKRRRVCAALTALCLAAPASASADRALSARFATNTQGDIAIAANSIESCLDALTVCANVRNAVGGSGDSGNNNNSRTMTWIDADQDPATFDSSSADLTLPAGARVLFAGLYYGGRLTKATGGSDPPNTAARNTVLFKAPGDAGYRSVTATQVDDASTQYQGFVNVTGIVAAAGAGTYWTANVQLGTGLSDASSGGWSLVVAYGDPAAPSRNLSVFDGLQNVSSSGSVTIPLSGFQTPLSGPVTSAVGIVAYEGDLATTGDGAALQGASGAFTALSNATNPANNLFNSTITNAGALVTSRTPSFQNNLGYDSDLFRTTGVLGNGQTSTQVRLSTNGDAYQPGVVTLATDLYAPQITATKTVSPTITGLGGLLTYTVSLNNSGQDAAIGSTFTDATPAGTVFVPGSIRVNGAVVTDATGDDTAEFAGGRVVARLGTGATATAGGSLATGASATVSFQVTVATSGLPLGTTVDNTADIAFNAATTGVASTVTTAPATTSVRVPDLVIGKTHSPALAPGADSTYTIEVGNVGVGPSVGPVTVTDTLEPGLTLRAPGVTGGGWDCSTAALTFTCTRSDPISSRINYPPILIPVTVDPGAQPGQLSNTATLTGGGDGNPDNNSVTDAGAVSEPAIDLHVEKVVTSTPNFTPIGYLFFLDPITYRIEVTNNGVANAANVQLTEILEAPLTLESIVPSQGSCSGTSCNLGTITPGQPPVTIEVQASAGTQAAAFNDYPSNKLLHNTATVSAPVGTEINPDDNSASAAISTVPWAETSITKTFAPEHPVAGGPVTYTLTVHSDGPGTVDYVAADLLPAALQQPPAAISITGGTGVCQYDPTGQSIGAVDPAPFVVCDIPQLGPGEDRVITIQGTLAPDSAGTQVDNLALSSNTLPGAGVFSFEPNFDNNDDSVSFTPGAVDVGITKSVVGASSVAVGDVATFRFVITNSGTQDASNVVVTDTLPVGLEAVDLPAGCLPDGATVSCAVGTLAAGAQQTIDLRARAGPAAAGTTVTNRASIRADETDLDPGNDTSSADLTIGALPGNAPSEVAPVDLAVTVKPPGGLATVGVTGSWTVRVVNHGPGPATNVTLAGTESGRAAVVGAALRAAPCLTSPSIRCGLGTLAPGASRTITVDLRPTAAGRLRLTGTVSAAERDVVPPNDTDEAAITVGLADVDLSATPPARTLEGGSATTITIDTVTRGRRPARNATVCVRVPKGVDLPKPAGATLSKGRVCWHIARLNAGKRRTFHLRVLSPRVSRARSVVLHVTVQGPGVRTRRARVLLRLLPARITPPQFTG